MIAAAVGIAEVVIALVATVGFIVGVTVIVLATIRFSKGRRR